MLVPVLLWVPWRTPSASEGLSQSLCLSVCACVCTCVFLLLPGYVCISACVCLFSSWSSGWAGVGPGLGPGRRPLWPLQAVESTAGEGRSQGDGASLTWSAAFACAVWNLADAGDRNSMGFFY